MSRSQLLSWSQVLMSCFHRNKAVANGAVYFFLEHYVSARVMKMTYGTDINVTYEADNPEHKARSHLKIVRPSGRVALNDAFSTIIQKVGGHLRDMEGSSSYGSLLTGHVADRAPSFTRIKRSPRNTLSRRAIPVRSTV